MRRLTLVAALALFATPALGQGIKGSGKYGTAGCGLGSLAFGDQAGGIQILAATTNSLFGTQTFGITSGTSNCGKGLVAADATRNFVAANREVLAKDISRGQGESIGALTVINACEDSGKVGEALQKDFAAIFPDTRVTDEQVTDAILRALHADPAVGCGKV